jgi:hypothetical protein
MRSRYPLNYRLTKALVKAKEPPMYHNLPPKLAKNVRKLQPYRIKSKITLPELNCLKEEKQ